MAKDKIKIVYLITGLTRGGAEKMLVQLVSNIDRKKYSPVVVSIISIAELGEEIQKKENIKLLSLEAGFKFNPLILFRMLKILKEEKPSILHSFLFHSNLLGRIAGKIKSVPIVISSIRNENFGGMFRQKLLSWTDSLARTTTVISKNVADKMVKQGIVSENRIKVIYNGIDLEKISSICSQEESLVEEKENLGLENKQLLISIGRLEEQKGYIYLLKAIRILENKFPKMKMLILGKGPQKEFLFSEIKKKQLEDKIVLAGEKDNVYTYLKNAEIFIMSSLWEGLPVALLEAMACGVIPIATKVGGIPEVIEDSKNGFLIDAGDARALATKIEEVINLSPLKKKDLRENVRERVRKKFSLDKMVEEYQDLYNSLKKI